MQIGNEKLHISKWLKRRSMALKEVTVTL